MPEKRNPFQRLLHLIARNKGKRPAQARHPISKGGNDRNRMADDKRERNELIMFRFNFVAITPSCPFQESCGKPLLLFVFTPNHCLGTTRILRVPAIMPFFVSPQKSRTVTDKSVSTGTPFRPKALPTSLLHG